jgi:hypothetical protein
MRSCRPDRTMATLIAAVGVVVATVVARGTARSSEVSSATGSTLAGAGAAGDAIRIWKIGSPHRGDTPPTTPPAALTREATRRGFRLSIEAFPARGFATTFFDAVARGAAPDLLVFDNFGVMQGITTALGHFDGIGQDPIFRRNLIKVTGAFDELLGPQRGWTYLLTLSQNHTAARSLALRPPDCGKGPLESVPRQGLADLVSKIATAYLEGDLVSVQSYMDPDRLAGSSGSHENVKVGTVQSCSIWGNDKFMVAAVNASFEAETSVGTSRVLLVLRKPGSEWQLLVVARDPVSNGDFLKSLSPGGLAASDAAVRAVPIPATLVSPAPGVYPAAAKGQRFGTFRWRSSLSEDVVAEIVEFAYHDDARLFFSRPERAGSRGEISAGALWTTRDAWYWRVWSISRSGDVVFSEVRNFSH